jgi:hypothetical protein
LAYQNNGRHGQVPALRKVYNIRGQYLYTQHLGRDASVNRPTKNRIHGTSIRIHRDTYGRTGTALPIGSK